MAGAQHQTCGKQVVPVLRHGNTLAGRNGPHAWRGCARTDHAGAPVACEAEGCAGVCACARRHGPARDGAAGRRDGRRRQDAAAHAPERLPRAHHPPGARRRQLHAQPGLGWTAPRCSWGQAGWPAPIQRRAHHLSTVDRGRPRPSTGRECEAPFLSGVFCVACAQMEAREAQVMANVHITPMRASRALALRYLATKFGVDMEALAVRPPAMAPL